MRLGRLGVTPRDDVDRTILRLAVPALGTLAIEPLYVVADTAIIGHLGTTALGGLAIAAQVLIFVIGCCNFLAYGTTQRLARHRGAGRREDAALVGVQALWLSMLIGVPLAIATAVFAEPVARMLGGEGATLDAAVTYLRISAISLPCVLVALVGHGVLRATRELRAILLVVAVASIGNVVLELVAVYVLDLGIAGSAWSTVIVQAVAAIAYLRALRPAIAPAPTWAIVPVEIVAMLRVGGLLLLRVGALLSTFTLATAVAARTDDATLGGHQIVSTTFVLMALVLDALAIPAQSLVAEALGANDVALARHVGTRVLALSMRFGVGLALVVAALSPLLPRVFSSDGAVIDRATVGLLVLAVTLVPGAVAFGLDGVLIGAAEFRFQSILMVAALAVFVPSILLVSQSPDLGIVGIWTAIAIWMTVRAAGSMWRWHHTLRIQPRSR
ncbi:MAG: MATE family efflux transporter [Acidimicrobiia bacterium]